MGPSADDIRKNMADAPVEEEIEQGPIQTAASYSKRVQARKAQTARLKKGGRPLGGAEPLDPEKMETLASNLMPKPNFGHEEAPSAEEAPPARQPVEPPPQVGGVGAAYPVNQKMARGELERPVSIKEAKKMASEDKPARQPLSQETVDGLAAAQQAIETDPPVEDGTPRLDQDDTSAELDKASEEMVNRNPDLFNFGAVSQAMRDMQSNKRRQAIEEKLTPLDVSDLITKQEIEQEVPVIPGKLSYTFRTINQQENLFCLQYLYDHPGSGLYVEEFLTTCKLTCSLVGVNGARLPDHRKGVGTPQEEIDKEEFEKKMKTVSRLPTHLIADISIQAIWFNDRVNKLFDPGALKNG